MGPDDMMAESGTVGVLSDDTIVCLTIHHGSRDGPAYPYDCIVRDLQGTLSTQKVSACLDYLFDLGMIDASWRLVDGMHRRCYRVSEDALGFVESAYLSSSFTRPDLVMECGSGTD